MYVLSREEICFVSGAGDNQPAPPTPPPPPQNCPSGTHPESGSWYTGGGGGIGPASGGGASGGTYSGCYPDGYTHDSKGNLVPVEAQDTAHPT